MAAAVPEVSATHLPMEILEDEHGSAAVVPTTAAPGVPHQLLPGATAANSRVRSNSRTPERGRTPDRGRASSRSSLQIRTMSPPIVINEEAAKKRRASSLAPPATPTTSRPGTPETAAKLLATVAKLQQQVDASTATSCASKWTS